MNSIKHWLAKPSVLLMISAGVFTAGSTASAAQLALVNEPLFLNSSAPPLNLLVLGRDHKLYYEAYNDRSDLNGDGNLDIGYNPKLPDPTDPDKVRIIDYYGYFDSHRCYTYTNNRFEPSTATGADKTCDGTKFSGDWLNYVTMSRIDALRKVLYGGTRVIDTKDTTVLERSHIPQDAHSWVKEYRSVAENGYDIRKYAPLSMPTGTNRHLFANVTLMLDTTWTDNGPSSSAAANSIKNRPPLLRIATDKPYRMWNWGSVESPVAGICASDNDGRCEKSSGDPEEDNGPGKRLNNPSNSLKDYNVRVLVCKSESVRELNCQKYSDGYKPVGLLQQYGRQESGADTMLFGLLTGSYQKSKSGGVLRKAVSSMVDEINTDGTFKSTNGIIKSLDKLRSAGYKNYRGDSWYRDNVQRGAGTVYTCSGDGCEDGTLVGGRPFNEGEFGGMWGNPVAEMMYEGLRYFAGKSGPLAAFDYGSNSSTFDAQLGLPRQSTWTNPYGSGTQSCAKPFELVMSDVNVSYDSDQLPGVDGEFGGGIASDLPVTFNASEVAKKIWDEEIGGTKRYFIGQSGAEYDGAPSPKNVSSFASIRGLAPEEPTKQGSYYAASVANYGLSTDINTRAGEQKVQTFAVALASPLPRVEIKVSDTNTIVLVPFGKSVGGGYGIDPADGKFQPTNQIVDFYMLEAPTATGGSFQVNYEDVEAGNDHDMDAIVKYTWAVNGSDVTITTESVYAAGGIKQHMGYVISGTTRDGIYLEVRDNDTSEADDVKYFLDTPNWSAPFGTKWQGQCKSPLCTKGLPLKSERRFTAGQADGAKILNDPLWYAAKWGGFKDGDKDDKPDEKSEWDANNDGNPDNYFLVTNALTLGVQLSNAFNEILKRTASASSATVNSGSVSSTSRVFQATFDSGDWTGHLLSYKVNQTNGSLITPPAWDAAGSLPAVDSRSIFTMGSNAVPVAFTWEKIKDDASLKGELATSDDAKAQQILEYIRGSDEKEATKAGGIFRPRKVKLGDIVNSSPILVSKPSFYYTDAFETGGKYSEFRSDNADRHDVIYAGANDGMLHAFDVTDDGMGKELFAYIPRSVFPNLKLLSATNYQHRYFVDGSPNMGDVFINGEWRTVVVGGLNGGGQGIYALDVTDPKNFSASNVLWEFTDRAAGDKGNIDLGYTFSQPAIVKLNNGKWGAIFGNGYNSSFSSATDTYVGSGKAALFIVDIESGKLIRKISTEVDNATTPNGLATPAVVDIDGDSIADFVFAGDLVGNMWKFDITDKDDADAWKVSFKDGSNKPVPLYTAKDASGNAQPITSRPEVARGPNGAGMVVLFGTGKYLELTDKIVDQSNKRIQSFYGILDPNTGNSTDAFSGRTRLQSQEIVAEFATPTVQKDVEGNIIQANVRVTSNLASGTRGWYMDLLSPPASSAAAKIYKSERVISNPIYRDGRVIFTTLIPQSDPCSYGGDSWIMELDALTGGRLDVSPFDVNRDGKIDENDLVAIAVGDTTIAVPVSGAMSEVGIVPEPGILADRDRPVEYKYTAGSSGNIQMTTESTDPKAQGRQSWRPVR